MEFDTNRVSRGYQNTGDTESRRPAQSWLQTVEQDLWAVVMDLCKEMCTELCFLENSRGNDNVFDYFSGLW